MPPFVLGELCHLTPGCWITFARSTPTGSSSFAVGRCSGTMQLKVIMSMYSLDSFAGRHLGQLLAAIVGFYPDVSKSGGRGGVGH